MKNGNGSLCGKDALRLLSYQVEEVTINEQASTAMSSGPTSNTSLICPVTDDDMTMIDGMLMDGMEPRRK